MTEEKRTIKQNSSLHLYFGWVADALNKEGHDVRFVLEKFKEGVDVKWTPILVKNLLWKIIQNWMYRKDSTTELLKKKEIDDIHEILNRFLGEKIGIEYIPFPSEKYFEEKMMEEAQEIENKEFI